MEKSGGPNSEFRESRAFYPKRKFCRGLQIMAREKKIQNSFPSLFSLVRHLWPYLKKHRLLLTGSTIALIGDIIFGLLEPWPLKWVVDELTEGENKIGIGKDPMEMIFFAA